MIVKQFLFVNVIMKGKTDTIGHLFKRVKRSLPVPYSFKRLKKSVQSIQQSVWMVWKSVWNTLASFQSIATSVRTVFASVCKLEVSVQRIAPSIQTVWHPLYSSVQKEKMHSSFLNSSWNVTAQIYVTKSYDKQLTQLSF